MNKHLFTVKVHHFKTAETCYDARCLKCHTSVRISTLDLFGFFKDKIPNWYNLESMECEISDHDYKMEELLK